jgi:hypothetical protein
MSPSSGGGLIARAYRLTTRPVDPSADEPVEVRPGVTVPVFVAEWAATGPQEAQALLDRFPGGIGVRDRTVVVVGRGAGDLAREVARRGATRAVALDMAPRRLLLSRISYDESGRDLPLTLEPYEGDRSKIGEGSFDLVVATDAFRDYGSSSNSHLEPRLEHMTSMIGTGGRLAIAMGPFWKAPFGGGGDSRMPWAHLVFPEEIVFEQFRRVRVGSEARTYGDIGINRITLARFEEAVAKTGLVPEVFEVNVGTGVGMRVARRLGRVGWLREYFSQNAFGVWRRD